METQQARTAVKPIKVESLIPEGFKFRLDADHFLRLGRVFAVVWSSLLQSANATGGLASRAFHDERAYGQVRRIISIANSDGKRYCTSFSTYLRRGLRVPGMTAEDINNHVVLYAGDFARPYVVDWCSQVMDIGTIADEDVERLELLVKQKAKTVSEFTASVVRNATSQCQE